MAKIIKSADLPANIAVTVFEMLNRGKIRVVYEDGCPVAIYTDVQPKLLKYVEGTYYAKGTFRNKHETSNGTYYEVEMYKYNGTSWRSEATYCTRFD